MEPFTSQGSTDGRSSTMNESGDRPSGQGMERLPPSPVTALDWRTLAEDRLQRLVEMEHDHAVIRDRLGLVQVDYREVLVANAEQLQRIRALDQEHGRLQRALADIENSHSWRLTRPLRTLAAWSRRGRHRAGTLVRVLLRVPALRRAARLLVRCVPGMGGYLRRRLHAGAGMPERGSLP